MTATNNISSSFMDTAYQDDYQYNNMANASGVYQFKTLPSLDTAKTTNVNNFNSKRQRDPKGPHRLLENSSLISNDITTSSHIKYHVEKPIVRSPRPQDFSKHLARYRHLKEEPRENMKDEFFDIIHKLQLQRKWTTTARGAMEESALPMPKWRPGSHTTLEEITDPVSSRFSSKHYNGAPMVWQHIGRWWDAVQLREAINKQKENLTLPRLRPVPTQVQKKEGTSTERQETNKNTCKYSTNAGLQFLRPIPGYRGYIPRHPQSNNHLTDEECVTTPMCSTTRQTHRIFPSMARHQLQYCHKGPLSRTVTLTYPYNPFNKIQKPVEDCKDWH